MSGTVTVLYFAQLRDDAGCVQQQFDWQPGLRAGDLFDRASKAHTLSLPRGALRVAVNDCFADWDQPIMAGDRVALMPPMSGG